MIFSNQECFEIICFSRRWAWLFLKIRPLRSCQDHTWIFACETPWKPGRELKRIFLLVGRKGKQTSSTPLLYHSLPPPPFFYFCFSFNLDYFLWFLYFKKKTLYKETFCVLSGYFWVIWSQERTLLWHVLCV